MTFPAPSFAVGDYLALQVDGDNVPFYPHFLRHPEAIERVPTSLRDRIQSTNIAYLTHRLAQVEAPAADPATDSPLPELVELRTKSEQLTADGVEISAKRLRELAALHRLPVLVHRGRDRKLRWIMSGEDWHKLRRHIATSPTPNK